MCGLGSEIGPQDRFCRVAVDLFVCSLSAGRAVGLDSQRVCVSPVRLIVLLETLCDAECKARETSGFVVGL